MFNADVTKLLAPIVSQKHTHGQSSRGCVSVMPGMQHYGENDFDSALQVLRAAAPTGNKPEQIARGARGAKEQ